MLWFIIMFTIELPFLWIELIFRHTHLIIMAGLHQVRQPDPTDKSDTSTITNGIPRFMAVPYETRWIIIPSSTVQ